MTKLVDDGLGDNVVTELKKLAVKALVN